jgi:predicted flap endonuclease-1-like 5' DNA nuclease
MQDLIATYWMWIAAALLAGAAVGYWLRRRQLSEGRFRHRVFWGTAACLAGLAAAILQAFAPGAELDLQMPLWLAFAFAIGGLFGGWLRAATERAELRRAAFDSHARVEAAMLGVRAKAAVRSDQDLVAQDLVAQNLAAQDLADQNLAEQDLADQDLAASDRATEIAHLDVVEAKAVEAKAVEDERLATAAKADNAEKPLDPVAAEMLGKSLPEQAAPIAGERKHPGQRPPGIATVPGKADDLKRIRGIGPRNAGRLHQLGIWHFSQIAAWTDDNVKWVGSYLAFSGRIYREDWVAQARELASGKEINKEIKKETNGEIDKVAESSPHVAAVKIAASKDLGSPGEGDVQPLK